MHFEDLVQNLATHLGEPSLTPDTQGAIALTTGDLVVVLRALPGGEGFILASRLGTCPMTDSDLLEAMMTENRWPEVSSAGVISLDTTGAACLMHRFAGSDLTFPQLLADLERFRRRADKWQARLVASTAATAQAATAFVGQGVLA